MLAALPGVRFVGIADVLAERTDRLAAAWGTTSYPSSEALLEETDVVVMAVPTREHFPLAEAAAARGVHVFLGWPPTTSLDEGERLARRAEEAGIEIGAARPLPVEGLLTTQPAGWTPRLITLDMVAGPENDGEVPAWPRHLAGALDLCIALARRSEVQRLEAEAVRGPARELHAAALSLRFRNGAFAQALIRNAASGGRSFRLVAVSPDGVAEADALEGPLRAVGTPNPPAGAAFDPPPVEMAAFFDALAAGRPAPFSILDGLSLMRLVERLMQRLR